MDKRKIESHRDTVFLFIACFMVILLAGTVGFLIGKDDVTHNEITQTQTQTMVINQGQEIIKVNINTCRKSDLMALPNIGDKLADRIIEYRNKIKIESVYQLDEIEGIGTEIIRQLEGRITFD